MTAAQALQQAIARLRAAGVTEAARDARRLLAHAARIEASRVALIAPDELAEDVVGNFERLVAARVARTPVSQLVGEREFYGRKFLVTDQVLDPRPETELLIECALAEPFEQVLDLGTGSGCILVTLLAEEPAARGIGVDLSSDALLVASSNAIRNGVQARVDVRQSDWFAQVSGQFDLIVANPPYIAAEEMPGLAPEVRDHEPRMALTDEGDGLSAYRTILSEAPRHLVPGGRLVVEIGAAQGDAVAATFQQARLDRVVILPDLAGHDRVVCGRAPL